MLILLLRISLVVLLVLVGLTSGQGVYRSLFEGEMPAWFGAAMGFGIAVTLIAAEQAFRRKFTRSLVAFLIGLGAGLFLAMMLLIVLRLVIQSPDLYAVIDIPVAIVTVYLVLITVLRGADRLRVVVPFVEFKAEQRHGGSLVLDRSALADGRVPALLRAGLSGERILIHQEVVASWESALNAGPADAARARRALDGLQALRALGAPPVEIDQTEIPNRSDVIDTVLRLARLEGGRVVAGDRETARRAQAEGIPVIDLAALAAAVSTEVRVGDRVSVLIEKSGEGRGQGIGHLDTGMLVVVSEAASQVGQVIDGTVVRLHPTSQGVIAFVEQVSATRPAVPTK